MPVGGSDRSLRIFLRQSGIRPTVANMERIGREVNRTQTQHETVERIHRELESEKGIHDTVYGRGDGKARVKAKVKRDLQRRGMRPK